MTPTTADAMREVVEGTRRYAVICADCLDVLQTLDLAAIQHVITDGPYGIGTYSETEDDGPYVEALRILRGRCESVSFFGYAETLVDWILRLGWGAPDEWVTWYPSNAEAKAGAQSKARLPKLAEHIAIYGTTPGVRSLRRERSKGGAKLAGKAGLIRLRRYSPDAALRATAQLGDVWTDASPGIGFKSPSRLHPNEKPVSLLQKLVSLTSGRDEVILDPFAGSGSTGVAALREGRRVVLIERDPQHAATARERMEAEAAGSTLQASRAGQLPLLGAAL